jgi:hypothetical protein
MADDNRYSEHDAWEREIALQFGITAMAGIAVLVAQYRGDRQLEEQTYAVLEPLVPRPTAPD